MELLRWIGYLDLSLFLLSLLQSINVFLHPLLLAGMGDAQLASMLGHKAGEAEERHSSSQEEGTDVSSRLTPCQPRSLDGINV